MSNQCKSCGYVNGGHVVGCKNDTPGGVPTADCAVCGRKGGHIMPIQDKSVKQYQEDIEKGVDVGESTHNLCKSTHNLGNLPKTNEKEVRDSMCEYWYKKGVKAENKAWVNGTRCYTCGKEFIRTEMTDTCPECWEEN
jgi:hypothetical protein